MACSRVTEVDVSAGSSADIVIPLTDDEGGPISSLAGWKARAHLRVDPVGPLIYEWSTEAETPTLVLEDSSAKLKMPGIQVTDTWAIRLAWFDLELTDPEDVPSRPIRTALRVTPAITHD